MEFEKRLERVEKGMTGLWVGFAAGLVVAGLACVLSLVAVFHRPAPAPDESSAAPDRREQPEARKASFLDDLERLEALKAKGAITQQEFDAKKQQLLAFVPSPPAAGNELDVDELDKLMRGAYDLYNKNIINASEYHAKKQEYLQRKVVVRNLTKDLEKAQGLYNQNILNASEHQALKQKILAGDPAAGKK